MLQLGQSGLAAAANIIEKGVITLALRNGSLPASLRSLHHSGAACIDVSQEQQTPLVGGLQPGRAGAWRGPAWGQPDTTIAVPAWPASSATSRTFSSSLPALAETSASTSTSTAPASHQPHAQRPHRVVLGPFPDLPGADQPSPASPSASPTSQSRRLGRKSRLRTGSDPGDNAVAGASGAAAGEAELEQAAGGDPQAKYVLDKLVGGMTKDGKKATARRVLLEAMVLMKAALKKGGLEDIK